MVEVYKRTARELMTNYIRRHTVAIWQEGPGGQLMSVSGTIGGLTENAAYTYDNYSRLVTSNQTTNGSSAQRRFAYDRNRSGVWDATSGGNQIQSVSLQSVSFPGTGSAPTNRITSVTSGTTFNYSYDANGNVTNDGLHGYTYDSENRVIKVDAGAAVYAYDYQNRRYKNTVGSSVTHYVWEGSRVVGEYNGSTGAMLVSYSYAGSRLFAKTGTTTQRFLSDRLSERLALTDVGVVVGRQGHLPFGEDFGESGAQEKHHFTNYERDGESGAEYAINRYYQSNIARFSSVDPIADRSSATRNGVGCGKSKSAAMRPNSAQSWGKYTYTENDPINKTDSLGLLLAEEPIPGFCPAEYSTAQCVALGLIDPTGSGDSGGGWGWSCSCQGTTDCSLYESLCEKARNQKLSKAAIHYYCKAGPKACNTFPKTGLGSCTSNCIRKCLQDWENSGGCFNNSDPAGDLFAGCELAAHIDCYTSCAICAL